MDKPVLAMPTAGAVCQTPTSSSGASKGSGLSSTPFTTVKIAATEPMPSASVPTVITVKPGARDSPRRANRASFQSPVIFDVSPRRVLKRSRFLTSRFCCATRMVTASEAREHLRRILSA